MLTTKDSVTAQVRGQRSFARASQSGQGHSLSRILRGMHVQRDSGRYHRGFSRLLRDSQSFQEAGTTWRKVGKRKRAKSTKLGLCRDDDGFHELAETATLDRSQNYPKGEPVLSWSRRPDHERHNGKAMLAMDLSLLPHLSETPATMRRNSWPCHRANGILVHVESSWLPYQAGHPRGANPGAAEGSSQAHRESRMA